MNHMQWKVYYYVIETPYQNAYGFHELRTSVQRGVRYREADEVLEPKRYYSLWSVRPRYLTYYDGVNLEDFHGTTELPIPKEFLKLDRVELDKKLILLHVTGSDPVPEEDMTKNESGRIIAGLEAGYLVAGRSDRLVRTAMHRDNKYQLVVESKDNPIKRYGQELFTTRKQADAYAAKLRQEWRVHREAMKKVDWQYDVLDLCNTNGLIGHYEEILAVMMALPYDSRSHMRYYDNQWLFQKTDKDDWEPVEAANEISKKAREERQHALR